MKTVMKLAQHKVLQHILAGHAVAVSMIKLNDYKGMLQQYINDIRSLLIYDQDEYFPEWCAQLAFDDTDLTPGDLSTLYIASQSPGSKLVITPKDVFMENAASECNIDTVSCHDFVLNTVSDTRLIAMYEMFRQVI